MTNIVPVYHGECMLLRWSETPKGRTVTLLLDPLVNPHHPFKNLKCGENGQRMQLAAVLIGDDEKPVPPPNKIGPVPAALRESAVAGEPQAVAEGQDKPRDYKRSQIAHLKCQEHSFQNWLCMDLRPQFGRCWPRDNMTHAEMADMVLKEALGIQSKSELDTNPEKAADWDRMLASFDYKDRA